MFGLSNFKLKHSFVALEKVYLVMYLVLKIILHTFLNLYPQY